MSQGKHPNSKANLEKKKFKKGEGGNTGRRYVQSRTLLKKMLARYHETNEGDLNTVQAAIMEQMVNKALRGSTKAFNAVFDRVEGKPIAHVKEHNEASSYLQFLGVLAGENLDDDIEDEDY